MPLPLLLAGAAVLAAGYGAKKGYDAYEDKEQADELNRQAKTIYNKAKGSLETVRENSQNKVESLGSTKFTACESIHTFNDIYQSLPDIEIGEGNYLDSMIPTEEDLNEIKVLSFNMAGLLEGGVSSIGAGGLAGLAAYGGVGALGTATTGTAIGTLSGAAATNATLAWLGGGSLASGGLGIAGGTAVLGGIIAGPVLAVGGMMLAAKAEEARIDAESNLYEAEIAAEEMKNACVVARAIGRRAQELEQTLARVNTVFQPKLELIGELSAYKSLTTNDKNLIREGMAFTNTLKNLVNTQLIDSDGTVTPESRKAAKEGRKFLEMVQG